MLNRLALLNSCSMLLLTACESAADRAEAKYEILRRDPTATASEKCEEAGRVASAYLQQQDEDNIRTL